MLLLGYNWVFHIVHLNAIFVFASLESIFLIFESVHFLFLLKILIWLKICHPSTYLLPLDCSSTFLITFFYYLLRYICTLLLIFWLYCFYESFNFTSFKYKHIVEQSEWVRFSNCVISKISYIVLDFMIMHKKKDRISFRVSNIFSIYVLLVLWKHRCVAGVLFNDYVLRFYRKALRASTTWPRSELRIFNYFSAFFK